MYRWSMGRVSGLQAVLLASVAAIGGFVAAANGSSATTATTTLPSLYTPHGYVTWAHYPPYGGFPRYSYFPPGQKPLSTRTAVGNYALAWIAPTADVSVQITPLSANYIRSNCQVSGLPLWKSTTKELKFTVVCTNSVTGAPQDTSFYIEIKA